MYYLIIVNVMAFILCFVDKIKAIYNWWRIPEDVLLFISFIGGCFGFLVGMIMFRHKIRKFKFKLVYLLCVLWIAFILWI